MACHAPDPQRDCAWDLGASGHVEAPFFLGNRFAEAWTEIAGNFGDDPVDIERARSRLAEVLLSVADEECRDVAVLSELRCTG
jgi:hypothetical protein